MRDAAVEYMSLGQGYTLGSYWYVHRTEGIGPEGDGERAWNGEALSLILPFDQDEGQPAPPAAHYMPKRL